uniref:Uncharacterized protein n=1 Tax=Alexandrium catenella TaxID=2925 RepID=A0A7S1MEN7_ALECA
MAVMLDTTGDLVLTGHDSFSTLTVDRTGNLALEHEELRNIIRRLARAMNQQHESVTGLQTEMDQVHGELHAIRMQSAHIDSRLSETEDVAREVRIKMERMSEELAELHGLHSQDEVPTREDIQAIHDRCDRLGRQLDEQDLQLTGDSEKAKVQIGHLESQLTKQQQYLDEELEARFTETDDAMLSQKMELEGLQVTMSDLNKRKANRSEMNDMQKVIEFVREEQKSESATLKEAHQNLRKLDDCVSLASENKTQTENLWRAFREEAQEIREWASKTLNELKVAMRSKMDEASALAVFDELQREVRKDKLHFAKATSRVEDGIKHKAEAGDVLRLQDAVQEFRQQTKKPKQLLVGTKCLACNRVATEDTTVESMVDAVLERQRDELYQEVQRALSKTDSGNEVLKFVSVHVGSPKRLHPAGGGAFDGRDASDHGPGSHYVKPATPRVLSRPATQTANIPIRAPPREVPPLVRMAPRRVEGPAPPASARGAVGARRVRDGYMTMRDAVGLSRRPTSPSTAISSDYHEDYVVDEDEITQQPSAA